jgi:hypothetical protein
LHFRNSTLSIGTGVGTVLFYDLRANKFLNDYEDKKDGQLKLQTTGGWIVRFENTSSFWLINILSLFYIFKDEE